MSKVMLITGAGRGIGATTAKLAAQRGYAVCINYAGKKEVAETVVADIKKAGGKAMAFQADVSDPKAVKEMFLACDKTLGKVDAAVEAFGKVDVLVNNAGIVMKKSRTEDIGAERLVRMFGVNVIGSFLCAAEAVKRMSTLHGGKGGAIVNVGSVAAKFGGPGDGVDYAAAKAAIHVFTLGLGKEVAGEGIRVNAVSPALIETSIHDDTGIKGRLEILRPGVPMQRIGKPEEVAEAILFLASDAASYCVGAVLEITGGRC